MDHRIVFESRLISIYVEGYNLLALLRISISSELQIEMSLLTRTLLQECVDHNQMKIV